MQLRVEVYPSDVSCTIIVPKNPDKEHSRLFLIRDVHLSCFVYAPEVLSPSDFPFEINALL